MMTRDWPVPGAYDEPEDNPEGFRAILTTHPSFVWPVIFYWDIDKARTLGVWCPDRADALGFNWYASERRFLRWWQRPFYIPFKCLQYRLRYGRPAKPIWGALQEFSGIDEAGAVYVRPSRAVQWWNRLCWRVCLFPRLIGFVRFRG